MAEVFKLLAVSGYEHRLGKIEGTERQYFRIDDKKDPDKITEMSKYQLVAVSAKAVTVLTIGKKDQKFGITTMEYEKDEKWAEAIRRLFSKKIISKIDLDEFANTFDEYIKNKVESEV